jgi:glycosyltransferase involved in cell wall biosynthesis
MYSRLSLWVTLTERMKKEVAQFTRFPARRVVVNPVGSDLTQFDPSKVSRRDARIRFGLAENDPAIGVLGRLDPQKGQEVLLRAAPEILKHTPSARFVIAGDETVGEQGYKSRLVELARELNIENSVVFHPFTDDVPEFMAAIDVFALPSFAETFGYVLIEAMAMEKPIVATNAGGVPEIITDGKTGLLVEPKDPTALAAAILKILKDDTHGISLGRTARAEALQKYNIARSAAKLIEAIDRV